MTRAARDCQKLITQLLPELAAQFDARHGTKYGPNFWRYLLAPWLVFTISGVTSRYEQLRQLVRRHADKPFQVQVSIEDPTWRPLDTLDVWSRFLNARDFDTWLCSRIIERIAPACWTLNPTVSIAAPPTTTGRHKGSLRNRVGAFLDGLRCRRVAGMGPISSIAFSAYLAMLPCKRHLSPMRESNTVSNGQTFDPVFLEILHLVIHALVPSTFTDRFQQLNAAPSRATYRKGKINLVGPVLFLNEAEQFKLAHAARSGEWIVCTQHGGQGYQRIPLPLAETDYRQDAFFTWGWKRQGDLRGRFVPLPSPMLGSIRNKHRERDENLVLVGTGGRISSLRLQTTEFHGRYSIESRFHKQAFIESVTPRIFERLLYRPYPKTVGVINDAAYFRANYPNLMIIGDELSESQLVRLLLRVRMVVVDHPVTTFTQCLAGNIPTIGYWNPDAWPMTEEAAPVFEALEEAGIVYRTGVAAAAAVNDKWHETQDWWLSEPVQTARNLFCHRYARTSHFWWWSWASTLKNL